jgi:N-methylhydantoinase A/oxoprolinase/acetone carboxylase beta subunit
MDVQTAAETCVELINVLMREHLIRSLMLGYDLRDYVLLGYGGAGPMHLAGYAGDYAWKGVATVPYAAAFSAWGGACMDYAHRRHKSVSAMIPPVEDPTMKLMAAQTVSGAWEELEKQLLEELAAEGFTRDQVTLKHSAFVKYFGHLDDLEVASPMTRLTNEGDVNRLMAAFEDVFTKTYTLAGKPPVPTFQIGEVGVVAEVSTVKPAVNSFELEGKEPPKVALKGRRPVYQQGKWTDAPIYEMDELRAGNEVNGVAIIEAPNTTLFVPPGWNAKLDEHMIFWMNRGGS